MRKLARTIFVALSVILVIVMSGVCIVSFGDQFRAPLFVQRQKQQIVLADGWLRWDNQPQIQFEQQAASYRAGRILLLLDEFDTIAYEVSLSWGMFNSGPLLTEKRLTDYIAHQRHILAELRTLNYVPVLIPCRYVRGVFRTAGSATLPTISGDVKITRPPLRLTAKRTSPLVIQIPFPLLIMPSVLLIVLEVCRMSLPAYRRRRNLCAECGYDLRASDSRCPECGNYDVLRAVRMRAHLAETMPAFASAYRRYVRWTAPLVLHHYFPLPMLLYFSGVLVLAISHISICYLIGSRSMELTPVSILAQIATFGVNIFLGIALLFIACRVGEAIDRRRRRMSTVPRAGALLRG